MLPKPKNPILETFFNIKDSEEDIKYTICINGKREGFLISSSTKTHEEEKIISLLKPNIYFFADIKDEFWIFTVMKKILSLTEFGEISWLLSNIEVVQAFEGIHSQIRLISNAKYFYINDAILNMAYKILEKKFN